MARIQSEHRQELERAVVNSNITSESRGQLLAFVVAIVCIASSVYCAMNGHDVIAGVLGGGTLVSLATVFVVGRSKASAELAAKRGPQGTKP